VISYQNAVGEDSINRFEEKRRKKKKKINKTPVVDNKAFLVKKPNYPHRNQNHGNREKPNTEN
jgi:hypothetical protein